MLTDAIDIAHHGLGHSPDDGPHVVTGPIALDGAEPGDVLAVEVLRLERRAPYGVISARHGYGALPGEMPDPGRPGPVSVFCEVDDQGPVACGVIPFGAGRRARFALAPFLGIMGVAVDTTDPVPSVPPGPHGGNLDVNLLGTRSRLYLPVQVPGALFYVGDPHFAQGDGEVSLTALEAPLRATLRLDVLKGAAASRATGVLREPFAETDDHWIVIGLHEDLDEAMRKAVRSALAFLSSTTGPPTLGMDPHLAYAYLSAAADFEVSQVVDSVKGVHCLIRKSDFD